MRMRIGWSLALLLLSATASAQDVRVTPKLKAGDAFRLEVTRVQNSTASPKEIKSTTTINARVLTATPEGSTLEWESTDNEIVPGMKPVIRLTRDGELAGLLNEADVLAKIQSVVDKMRRELRDKPAAERKAQEAIVELMTPAVIMAAMTRDAGTYFGLNGVALAMGQSVTVEMTQPNPIGSGTLPVRFNVRIDTATPDIAVLATTTTYDAAALMRAGLQIMEKIGDPIPPNELAKHPPLQIGDEGRFVLDRASGLMREVITYRRIMMAGQTRIDRTEFRLVAVPKR